MAALPTDPSVLLKQASDQLREAQQTAGLDKADGLVKQLDDIKATAEQGPGDLLDKLKDALKAFMDSIDDAMRDPASLLGGGGILSACASYYGSVVLGKLKDLRTEADQHFATVAYLASTVAKPFGELGKGLKEVITVLVARMKQLTTLPQLIESLTAKVKGDVTELDVSDLKKTLDLSSLEEVFDKLGGLKGSFGPVMGMVSVTLQALAAFIEEAPGKLHRAFEVPLLGGCMAGPAHLQAILQELEVVKRLDHQPLLETLATTKQAISEMDVERVRKPMEAFSKSALEQLNDLEGAVKGAKAAQEAANAGAAAATMLGGEPAAAAQAGAAAGHVVPKQKMGCKFWGK